MIIRVLSATTFPVLCLRPSKNSMKVFDLKDLTIIEKSIFFITEKRESALAEASKAVMV